MSEAIIDRFSSCRVLVIGDAMIDAYVDGQCDRLCREAPVPIIDTRAVNQAPGGGANAAAAAAMLGAQVRFLSVVGADAEGDWLAESLAGQGVGVGDVVTVPTRATMVKQRVSGNGRLLFRLDRGDGGPVPAATAEYLIARLGVLWAESDVILISDYAYGVLTDRLVAAISRLQAANPRILTIDARDLQRWRAVRPTLVKPNYAEALALCGRPEPVDGRQRVAQIGAARQRLADATGAAIVAATLDRDGALVFARGAPAHRTQARPAPDDHCTGAGDVYLATFALALASSAAVPRAAEIAAGAAAVAVRSPGTSLCSADALAATLTGSTKVLGRDAALAELARRRQAGRRIVFTNGCFDLMHRGHVSLLDRARELGDVLVVGLNSDASVRALKGPARPINPEGDRARVLAGLGAVDLVVLFEEATPKDLIRAMAPDVYVKGGDYTLETLPEAALIAELGGEVVLIDTVPERSTTGTIERVLASAGPRAAA